MDINQDNSRKCTISEDSMDCTEQTVSTLTTTCGIGKDAGVTEDLGSRTRGEMDSKEFMTEKSTACKSETSEKDIGTSTSFTDPRETWKDQHKSLTGNPDIKKDKSFEKITDEESSETFPRAILPEHDLSACPRTEHEASGLEVKNKKYKRNLEKFLKDETSWKNRTRDKAKMFERVIKSDGEIAKITNYCGHLKKISSVLSMISLGPSSAPPTYDTESKQSPQIYTQLITSIKSEKSDNYNVMHESIKINLENQKTPVSVKTDNPSSIKASDSSLGESSGLFKVPTVPTSTEKMLHGTPKSNSSGTSKTKDSAATPVLKRPKDFNVKTRRTFYTFSPHPTGVLRQCLSLPNINRPPRKQEKHRRSLILDNHPRLVRSLFCDESEPSTPKTKESVVPKDNFVGVTSADCAKEESESCSRDKVSLSKETDRKSKSKTCRKLCFNLPAHDETEKVQPAEETKEVVKGKSESPLKRKGMSPQLFQSSSTSVKKVRISPELKRSEEDTCHEKMENIHSASEEGSKDYPKPSCSPGKKASPMKRKALEGDEGTASSKTNVSLSKSPMKRKAVEGEEGAASSKTKVSPSKIISRSFL